MTLPIKPKGYQVALQYQTRNGQSFLAKFQGDMN